LRLPKAVGQLFGVPIETTEPKGTIR